MIGDGMGVAQVYAGYTALHGKMNITSMPVSGFVTTFSANSYITDSGAGATAFSTGHKTNNYSIGVGVDGKPLPTVLEIAAAHGLNTGLVATSAITHATPAGFIAHTPSRSKAEDIALDFLKTPITVFIGGGYNHFAVRSDSLNLIDSLLLRGYTIARDLRTVNVPTTRKLAALLAPDHLPAISAGRGNMLPDATDMALKVLSKNPKGFFCMVEGSQIDWGGHDNNKDYIVQEVVDFDKAVGEALAFAAKDGLTLVVVTADHETGGFGITGGDIGKGIVEGAFLLGDHTATMVPLFAYGPGAELFTGVQDNTDIFKKFVQLLRLPNP